MSELALQRIREAKAKHLTELDLSTCGLSQLPNELFELIWLKTLFLDGNQIRDVSPLAQLNNLSVLFLNGNNISNISSLAQLKHLDVLDLSGNEISDTSPLAQLTKLTVLSLRSNQISDISPVAQLINLTQLYLYNNQIRDITSLCELSNIKLLLLFGNKIRNIKPLIRLIEKGIPLYLELKLNSDEESHPVRNNQIVVGNNPLEDPPANIVEQGNEAVLTYFRNLEEQGEGKLNEAKLIIVGEPEAGKTSLMKKLLNPNYAIPQPEDSTLGIHVSEGWKFPRPDAIDTTFSANIWDFGGQQIQYMTHQFFLTPGAVYVLVSANDRKETIANFRYWFKIIHLLGEEKGVYSPVLVIQNDKNEQFIHQFDEIEYQRNYPELQISKRTLNLGNDVEFQALQEEIQRMLTHLPHVNDARPARWGEIRTTLRTLAKERNHINFSEYAAICNEHQVKDESSQLLLSYYLHRLGSLLHFSEDPALRDFIILNPQWAVDAVYSVLSDNSIAKADGRFTQDKLANIWQGKYDTIEQGKLLNLMKRDNFEICYELECAKHTFIAPQLLNERRPFYEWHTNDTLKFRFQYKFMPEGIVTRLIVRLNDLIAKGQGCDLVWLKGMVLERNGCRAQIQEEENRDGLKVIDIAVTGKLSERKYLLHTIRDEIENLHRKWFRNIQAEQMVPCNCEICIKSTEPSYFSFDELQQYLDENAPHIKCRNGRLKDVRVQPLLEGVFESEELKQSSHRIDLFSKEFPSQIPEIHNHIHLPSPTELVRPVQAEPQPVVPPLPTSEKWYDKHWWAVSLIPASIVMIIAGILAWLWTNDRILGASVGAVLGVIVYVLMFLNNPKRRFFRAAWFAFFGFLVSASPWITGKFGYSANTPESKTGFALEWGEPMNVVLSALLLVLAGFLFHLDSKQK